MERNYVTITLCIPGAGRRTDWSEGGCSWFSKEGGAAVGSWWAGGRAYL